MENPVRPGDEKELGVLQDISYVVLMPYNSFKSIPNENIY